MYWVYPEKFPWNGPAYPLQFDGPILKQRENYKAIRKGIRIEYLVFDLWFLKDRLVKFIK
jgi:hypothetical protein